MSMLLVRSRLFLFIIGVLALKKKHASAFCGFTQNQTTGERFLNSFVIEGDLLGTCAPLMRVLERNCSLQINRTACIAPVCTLSDDESVECRLPVGASEFFYCDSFFYQGYQFIWDNADKTASHDCILNTMQNDDCQNQSLDPAVLLLLMMLVPVVAYAVIFFPRFYREMQETSQEPVSTSYGAML